MAMQLRLRPDDIHCSKPYPTTLPPWPPVIIPHPVHPPVRAGYEIFRTTRLTSHHLATPCKGHRAPTLDSTPARPAPMVPSAPRATLSRATPSLRRLATPWPPCTRVLRPGAAPAWMLWPAAGRYLPRRLPPGHPPPFWHDSGVPPWGCSASKVDAAENTHVQHAALQAASLASTQQG